MRIEVSLRRVATTLVTVLVLLAIASFCAEYARYILHSKSAVVDYFSLNEEQNVPTWWSSYLLLACSAVLVVISTTKTPAAGQFRRHWRVLAGIFCYMSLDELVEIHEWLNNIPALGNLHGAVYYGWVIPVGIAVLLFAVSYLKFLFHLPVATRNKVALSGAIYVGGALGVEMLLGLWTDKHGELNFAWAMIDMLQEAMEIAGASLFLYALLEYLGRSYPDLTLAIRSGREGEGAR